jgi:hypothetical protein
MKKELQQQLFDIAPEWFKDKDNLHASLMAFGFEVGDGWFGLLKHGMEWIRQHIDSAWGYDDKVYPYDLQVVQVKEKFGTLRFYVHGGDDRVDNIISAMEMASSLICEWCGAAGELRDDGGWYTTLCDACQAQRIEERELGYREWEAKRQAKEKEQAQQESTGREG